MTDRAPSYVENQRTGKSYPIWPAAIADAKDWDTMVEVHPGEPGIQSPVEPPAPFRLVGL